jgi:hypothetical protein
VRLLPVLRKKQELERSDPFVSLQEWAGMLTQFAYNGSQYTVVGQSQEDIAPNYSGIAQLAYKTDPVVFACVTVRQLLLSEARFAFRERRNGRPGNLFTTADLVPLEEPWPGATTGDLIARMELDASLAGNWFGTNRYGGVRTLRPDWVTLIVGSNESSDVAIGDPEAEVVGYVYHPGGRGGGRDPVAFLPEEVAHYAPHPDPIAHFRGMSWITSVIREVMADKAATDHKLSFFENAATPNLHVSVDVPDLDSYEAFVEKFREKHESVANAYKTLFTTKAVEVHPVGSNLQQMDFKVTQGAGETRIAAAARTPPVLVGLSEGLQGSSLNAGNFEASMRSFTDMFARPEWRNMAGSLARIMVVPPGAELWYDDRDIPALKEDIRKAGERMQADSTAISTFVMAGFDPASAVDAVGSGDLSRLKPIPGFTSVQLQPGGPNGNGAAPAPANGNGKRSDDERVLDEYPVFELMRTMSERERPIEIHNHVPELEPAQVNFHEGAFMSHTTVEASEPSRVEIAEGAFRSETTVEPARVDFAEGSVRVDAPITVEPAQVTVEAARPADVNVTVEPSAVTVEAAPVPDVNVTVEPARVEIGEGAVHVDAPVTVEPASVTVEAAPTPDVNVTVEAARVETPDVNVTVEPAQVTVEAAKPPDVNVTVEQQRPRNARAKREEDGSLTVSYDDEETPDGGSETES